MLKKKKGQITLFIIIGIIIVIGGAVYYSFFYGQKELVSEEERGIEVPLEVKPVKDFVESCMNKLGIDALKLAGQHGGYIYPLDRQYSEKDLSIDFGDPSSSDGVALTESSEGGVVYWWYMKTPNECFRCLSSDENIPGLDMVERQTDRYIEDNLETCLEGFRSFEDRGFDVDELELPVASTIVTEEDVVVSLAFPIDVSLMNKSTRIERFVTHIPIDLRRAHNLATNIARTHADTDFLEYMTKSWIVSNSGLHTGQLPPFFGIEESYAPKIWVEEIVKMQLQDLLISYISMLQVNETKGAEAFDVEGDAIERGMYRGFFLNILNESYDDYRVRFLYLGWPIYLHITPSDNGVLTAGRVTDIEMMIPDLPPFIPMVPQREYEFFYDLSYPVVVEIRNDDDLYGDGFTWMLGLEVNIRDNRGLDEWFDGNGTYGPWDYSWVTFEAPADELSMVEGGEDLSLVSEPYKKDLFCSPKQRLSGNISVIVKDALNESVLEDVEVKYSCGRYASCTIGRTGFDIDKDLVLLEDKFPVCVGGGVISLERSGYKTTTIYDLSTLIGKTEEWIFDMMPVSIKKVEIKALTLEREVIYREPLEDHATNYTKILKLTGGSVELDKEKESMIVNVRKIDEPPVSPFPPQNIVIDNSSDIPKTIKLVPGIYEIRTTYIDNSGYFILPEERCKDGDEDCIYVPESPGMALDQTIGGGVTLDEVNGYWSIDENDIAAGEKVVFKVLKLPPPVVLEDLNEMSMIDNLTYEHRSELQPEFV